MNAALAFVLHRYAVACHASSLLIVYPHSPLFVLLCQRCPPLATCTQSVSRLQANQRVHYAAGGQACSPPWHWAHRCVSIPSNCDSICSRETKLLLPGSTRRLVTHQPFLVQHFGLAFLTLFAVRAVSNERILRVCGDKKSAKCWGGGGWGWGWGGGEMVP